MSMTKTVTTVADLRAALADARPRRVGLVPTMGALHEGHLSLVREARLHVDMVVVSVFVNPAQFAPNEDFDSYPRTLDADLEKLNREAELVFAPTARDVYPQGYATRISVDGPGAGLESDFRPHFFSGVATVVAKLLVAASPDVALFGEKDYQQLQVVRRMVRDLGLPVEIIGAPTLREPDGLALSSRNAYLSPDERKVAGRLNVILKDAIIRARQGDLRYTEAWAMQALRESGFDTVDYVAIRDAQTLAPVTSLERPARILAAARVGKTRLIDNMAV
jgi:pantoate--beta-alanine ligase